MTQQRDLDTLLTAYMVDGMHDLPDHVVEAVLGEVHRTRQRAVLGPWRTLSMNSAFKLALAAAAVVVVALVGINLVPQQSGVGNPGPSQTPAASPSQTPAASPSPPATLPDGPLAAGTYAFRPFSTGPGLDSTCLQPPQSGCVDPGVPTSMQVTLTIPDGWDSIQTGVWLDGNGLPGGAALGFGRGGWLYSDPCRKPDTTNPDLSVGPSVDDFVNALADHPLLDTTEPVDITVDGYAGKAIDLQVPNDISQCEVYRPWQPNIYAQGPGHLWHLRVIDVDGDRVVIQSMDYAGTDAQRRSELEAMVDSIQIEP
jgi:hypothetical protein